MEKVKKSLVKKEYLVPFVLVTSLFFLWGFAHAILDVLNKHFQEALVMTKAHSALIQATMSLVISQWLSQPDFLLINTDTARGWCSV